MFTLWYLMTTCGLELPSLLHVDLETPSRRVFFEAQRAVQLETELRRRDDQISRYERGADAGAGEMQLLTTRSGKWWVPDVQSLRLRMCFSAHAVDGVHYGVDLCKERLTGFYWDTMEEEVRDFYLQCVHCSTVRHLYRAGRSIAYNRNVGSYKAVLNWDYLFDPRPVEDEHYQRRDAVHCSIETLKHCM